MYQILSQMVRWKQKMLTLTHGYSHTQCWYTQYQYKGHKTKNAQHKTLPAVLVGQQSNALANRMISVELAWSLPIHSLTPAVLLKSWRTQHFWHSPSPITWLMQKLFGWQVASKPNLTAIKWEQVAQLWQRDRTSSINDFRWGVNLRLL